MKKYSIIYADPAWSFNNKKTGGSLSSGASAHYDTMAVGDMCDLPINEIADDNCVLFMWWVGSQPKEAIILLEAWGFTLKTMTGFNWVKTTVLGKLFFGMGFWTRAGSECCLIAVKGKPKRINAGIRSVIKAPIDKHSKKPSIFREEIVKLMGDVPRVELFARNKTEGWDVWGNEVEDSITMEN
jgi:N6-adenosine-specific RNA methylase IME4